MTGSVSMTKESGVTLKRDGRVFAAQADTGCTWRKRRGQYELLDARSVHRVAHTDLGIFRSKVSDFHTSRGEFSFANGNQE